MHTKFIFITFHIHQIHFSCGPQGGGPVAFSTAIITWCKLYASYYLFGAESLFNLAVLDCVKPDIDQVASVVYCMIEWKLKRRQIKLFEITIQNTGKQTTTQKFSSQEPRWNSSATTAQQLLDYTATACCIQGFNLSSSHLSPFGCNKVTTSVEEVLLYLFKKRKLFSRNTTVYTCILIIKKEYKE